MKTRVTLAALGLLAAGIGRAQAPCGDLYISEYLEGSSNNKALELYNPTGAAVDLSGYVLSAFNNGGTSPTNTLNLAGTLAAGDVYVIANPSADSLILAEADTTSSVTFYNGDDAIVLFHGADTLDIIGIVGVDPGSNWPVGSGATNENTLVRQASVQNGTTDWALGATQWDVYPQNDFSFLGAHTQDPCAAGNYTLQILHASDLEGGVEAVDRAANFAAIMDRLEDDYANTVILSAGDNYIPGPFFSAANDFSLRAVLQDVYDDYYGGVVNNNLRQDNGRVDVTIMNVIGFDASAMGNHEFDAGTDAISTIIGADVRTPAVDVRWVGSQFPYLSANLDFSADGNISGLFIDSIADNGFFRSNPNDVAPPAKKSIAPSTLISRGGELIGVVGATTPLLATISSPGNTTVIGSGSNDMVELAGILQPRIDDLEAAGANKIILVSHLQQISLEQALAPLLSGVDVIIAGGSDTRLANPDDRLAPGDVADAGYPLVAANLDGEPVAIVSTDGEYSYVGRLVVEFDAAGVVVPASLGTLVDGPYVADSLMVADLFGGDYDTAFAENTKGELVQRLTDAVRGVVIAKDGNTFGLTDVYLDGRRSQVRTQETNMGDLTADANLFVARQFDPEVSVSIKNGGGIRAAIGEVVPVTDTTYVFLPPQANPLSGKAEGEVSQLDIENSLRFNNLLSVMTTTAQGLVDIIEHGISGYGPGETPGSFAQVAGVHYAFDPAQPAGSRLTQLAIVDANGEVADAILYNGQLNGPANRRIKLVTLNFLAGGGDGYPFPSVATDRVDLDGVLTDTGVANFAIPGSEQDALAEYLAANFSVTPYAQAETDESGDERIQILDLRGDSVYAGAACIPALVTRPANLNAAILGGTIGLTWDPVPNTVGCQVTIRELVSGQSRRFSVIEPEPTAFTFSASQITPGNAYAWNVRCACSLDPLGFGLYAQPDTFAFTSPRLAADFGAELYPNPVSGGTLFVRWNGEASDWSVVDATGRTVLAGQVAEGTQAIDLRGLPSGLYRIERMDASGERRSAAIAIP